MQGVYLWSSFSRMEWIKIESSADGQAWRTDWHAVLTKPVSGPVYYGLANAGATRYVRITGYGSDLNQWSNLTEVRWSLQGYNVGGAKVRRDTSSPRSYEASAMTQHDLLGAMTQHMTSVTSMRGGCAFGQEPSFSDATGFLDQFVKIREINGRKVYALDWDHYEYRYQRGPGLEGPVAPFYDYDAYVFSQPEFNPATNATRCGLSGRADRWYYFSYVVQEIVSGVRPPTINQWQ
jgi:hypothetical protein